MSWQPVADWPWAQPTVVVLGGPGTAPTPERHPCLLCARSSPVTEIGLMTYRELRGRGELVLMLCHQCHHDLRLDETLGLGERITTGTLRGYKGLSDDL